MTNAGSSRDIIGHNPNLRREMFTMQPIFASRSYQNRRLRPVLGIYESYKYKAPPRRGSLQLIKRNYQNGRQAPQSSNAALPADFIPASGTPYPTPGRPFSFPRYTFPCIHRIPYRNWEHARNVLSFLLQTTPGICCTRIGDKPFEPYNVFSPYQTSAIVI